MIAIALSYNFSLANPPKNPNGKMISTSETRSTLKSNMRAN